jgi:adhesin/invasin
VDVFDFDSRGLADLNLEGLAGANSKVRYRVDVNSGPGIITRDVSNDGDEGDLVADDNLSSASFELMRGTGADQDTVFSIIDLAAAGYPSKAANLEISSTTQLRATLQPTLLDQGETIQIIAFAQDEFGLASPGHDLRITVESGSGEVIGEGRMYDDGLEKVGFMDPVENDGMYVGAVRATGTTGDTIALRITDLTSPNEPSIMLGIEVGR